MKIAELKTLVVGNPPPAFGGRYFLFLKLKTACGIEGAGEGYAAILAPKAIVAMIEDVFERHVAGADPFRIEALWRNVYGRGYSGRPDISLMGVLSGIEMALWDIVGKSVGKPVYALLGGKVHERLRSYTYLYPRAAGERLTTKYEFARLLELRAAAIVQMALGRVGGLLEAKKIAGMAEAHYAQIAPHLYCGPIEGAANVQLAACSPNFLILESIETWSGFHAEILKKPIRWEQGYVIPSSEPGLGVELHEEVALANPYTGAELHLVPTFGPVGAGD